jgi:4-amino-4-deoxy-L-arabinose transferase-like glycosyltransferase
MYFGEIFKDFIGGFNALANTILVARYLQVFLALLTVLLVYECGRLLYDRKTGLVAAMVLALAPAHIVATQTVRPDAISALLVLLIAFLAAKLLKSEPSGHRKFLMYSGIAIGAAAAFRLPLIGFGLMPVFAYVIVRQRANGNQFQRLVFNWGTLWFAVTIVLAYIVLSPHTLMYPEAFVSDIKLTMEYETGVFPDALDRGPVFIQYAWRLLSQALGYPVYFLALGGVIYALVRRRDEDKVVLVGIGLYFIMLSSITWTVVRYLLPILPLLALLSGVAVIRIFEQAHHVYARRIIYCIAGFLLAWVLAVDLALLHVVASKNTRDLSSEWITQHIPRDKSIVVVKNYAEDDFFNPAVPPYHSVSAFYLTEGLDSRELFGQKMFDYLVLHELLYADMERLRNHHPRKVVREFYENMKNAKLRLVKEFKVPYQFMGIDFSSSFDALDFSVINPGIRIYQAQ